MELESFRSLTPGTEVRFCSDHVEAIVSIGKHLQKTASARVKKIVIWKKLGVCLNTGEFISVSPAQVIDLNSVLIPDLDHLKALKLSKNVIDQQLMVRYLTHIAPEIAGRELNVEDLVVRLNYNLAGFLETQPHENPLVGRIFVQKYLFTILDALISDQELKEKAIVRHTEICGLFA